MYIQIYVFCWFVSYDFFFLHTILSTRKFFKQIFLANKWGLNKYYHLWYYWLEQESHYHM